MSNYIKICGDIFQIESYSVQLSTGSHANISISIYTFNNSKAYNFFINKYDNTNSKDLSFDIEHHSFKAYGCMIKSMDLDNMNYMMHLNIICDYFNEVPISERRDQMITDILDKNNFDKN